MIQIIVANLKLQQADRIVWVTQIVTCLAIGIGWMPAIVAQPNPASAIPEICETDFNLLKSDPSGDRRSKAGAARTVGVAAPNRSLPSEASNIITADTVSDKGMTLPSLWWTSEQFPAKLVTNWIADRNQKQVYLLVNAQYWDLLDYIDRYRMIDQFGRVAQGYGYNLKLCSSQKIVLARYSCDVTLNNQPDENDRASCQIWLNATGQNGLGVKSK